MKKILLAVSSIFLPAIAGAQSTIDLTNLGGLFTSLTNLINTVIPFLIGLAVLFFIYSLVRFITSAGDEGTRESARNQIIYGIILIAVMVSVWGLVNFVLNTFGLNSASNVAPYTPKAPTN